MSIFCVWKILWEESLRVKFLEEIEVEGVCLKSSSLKTENTDFGCHNIIAITSINPLTVFPAASTLMPGLASHLKDNIFNEFFCVLYVRSNV